MASAVARETLTKESLEQALTSTLAYGTTRICHRKTQAGWLIGIRPGGPRLRTPMEKRSRFSRELFTGIIWK